jgi:limonene-1,2-epoxide hydrolase
MTPIERYVAFYTAIAPSSLDRLDTVFAPLAHFRDPFNDVHGLDAIRAMFAHMFETVAQPRFSITHVAEAGDRWLLRWVFEGRMQALGAAPWRVVGMSEVRLGADGRVVEHIDHWDAAEQFYERLPLLGAVLRWIKRRARG